MPWVTEADCVMPPERLCIDQRPRHPWLILRELDGLEGAVRDTEGWLSEAQATAAREAETRVIARIALQEDKGNRSLGEDPKPCRTRAEPIPRL